MPLWFWGRFEFINLMIKQNDLFPRITENNRLSSISKSQYLNLTTSLETFPQTYFALHSTHLRKFAKPLRGDCEAFANKLRTRVVIGIEIHFFR